MSAGSRRNRPSWRVSEGRAIRPELWLIAAVAVAMLLVNLSLAAVAGRLISSDRL